MKARLFTSAILSFFIVVSINAQTTVQSDVLDVNNIRANINSNGRLFSKINDKANNNQGFEIKSEGKHTIHIASIWMGGRNGNKYHIFAPTFGQWGSDVFAGPVMNEESYSETEDTKWNRVWHMSKSMVQEHISNFSNPEYIMPDEIRNWPGNGDVSKGQAPNLAPYADVNTNGKYDPENGDYPLIKGDEAVLFIFNDHRGKHTESGTYKMGMEIIGLAYAFDKPWSKAYDNTVFVDWTAINRSGNDYKDVKLAVFTDIDIGEDVYDEYQGSIPEKNTYFGYNSNKDKFEPFGRYDNPFMSVTLLNEDFRNYMTYNNDWSVTGNPFNAQDYYHYLHMYWKDGFRVTKGGGGKGGNEHAEFMFTGNPEKGTGWNEKSLEHIPGDRRGLGLIGPFDLADGEMKKISVAYHFAKDFDRLEKDVDRFTDDFKNNDGPFAPESPDFAASDNLDSKPPIDMIIYPNPMREQATLEFSNPNNKDYSIVVYDIVGKQVFSESGLSGTRYVFEKGKLESGAYVIEVIFENQRNSARLIIQ